MLKRVYGFLVALLLSLSQLAPAKVVISELDLANSRVELFNTGSGTVDLTGYRWCNFITGNPRYPGVSASDINTTLSSDSDLQMGPGQVLVFDLSSAFLPAGGGELGLYLPSAAGGFGSRSAMVDYLNYGSSNGFRDSVAAGEPAIWVLDTAVDLSGAAAGDTIQLKLNAPGDAVGDYVLAPATMGVAQSVEVEQAGDPGRILKSGFTGGGLFFIEFEFDGDGPMKLTESTDLRSGFTQVAARTQVTSPVPNRREFALPFGIGRMFFRIEED